MNASLFRRQIAIPQDHGSWVFILSPLLVGFSAGGNFSSAGCYLIVAAMAAFLLRQPVTVAVKAYSGRRTRTDLPAARFWILVYCLLILLALAGLIIHGHVYLFALAFPGILVFSWHLWLVSRRDERKQAGVEIIATGVLSLAAPASYWVSTGHYNPLGIWLWLLAWFQSAASIIYAYLRLEQRFWKSVPDRVNRFQAGRRSLVYTSFNLLATLILGLGFKIIPLWVFIPYLLQWLENLWGIEHPAVGWKPTRVGIRQLIVSSLWTLLFIIFWRL